MEKAVKDIYGKGLNRNLSELSAAWLEKMVLPGLESAGEWHGMDFFRISYYALFNSMIGHLMKVLDRHKDCASFWYIYELKKTEIDSMFSPQYGGIKHIEDLADRLKHVRDKTHFHIDKKAVFDPKQIWKDANLTDGEVIMVMQHLLKVLNKLHTDHFDEDFPMPDYNGDDAYKIVKLAEKEGLLAR